MHVIKEITFICTKIKCNVKWMFIICTCDVSQFCYKNMINLIDQLNCLWVGEFASNTCNQVEAHIRLSNTCTCTCWGWIFWKNKCWANQSKLIFTRLNYDKCVCSIIGTFSCIAGLKHTKFYLWARLAGTWWYSSITSVVKQCLDDRVHMHQIMRNTCTCDVSLSQVIYITFGLNYTCTCCWWILWKNKCWANHS